MSQQPITGNLLSEGPPAQNPTAGRVALYSQDGRVMARMSDGTDVDLGPAGLGDGTSILAEVEGAGRGIDTAVLRPDGHLVLTLTDGQVFDVGDVVESPSNDLVAATVRSSDKNLILTLRDGSTINAGVVGSGGGAITSGTPLDGGTFTAPNGTRWLFGVNNSGQLITTQVTA